MAEIYLSYGPGDEAAAIIVHSFLLASGWDCWRIPPHTTVTTEEQWAALREARLLVLLWSAHAAASAVCACDWEYAVNRKRPVMILLVDDTPLPAALRHSAIIGPLQGAGSISRLVQHIRRALAAIQPITFLTPLDAAFVDFICWFFEAVQWDYHPGNTLFPLSVSGIPDLPAYTCRVKFVCCAPEDIQDLYSVLCQPYPLLLFNFDQEAAFQKHLFFQTEVWLYLTEWQAYHWHFDGDWRLIAQPANHNRYGA